MNSSGIKRGLAASAIGALAIAGIPALATSASAATGDELVVAFVGPARDSAAAGAIGAEIVLETKGVASVADATARLKVINAALTGNGGAGSADNPNQTIGGITVVGLKADNDTTQEFGVGDGYQELTVRIPVDTAATGGTASFALFLDDAGTPGVQASEARVPVSVTTSGPVAQIEVSPAGQTAPEGVASGNYTVTLRDNGGRVTQLLTGETVTVTPSGAATATEATIEALEATRGTRSFTAQAATKGLYTINLAGPNATAASATLDVVTGANLTDTDVDVVTAADGWNGFGGGPLTLASANVPVRVDQTSIRIDIRSAVAANRGATVSLDLTGTGITFGGKTTGTVSTILDANGVGSLVITPDAGTVQEGDTIAVRGNGFIAPFSFQFQRPALTAANVRPDAATYVSKIDGSVDVTVTARDQFGQPIAGAYVDARRAGQNNDAAPQARKATDANGKVTFTFTDVNAVPNTNDTVSFQVYDDQFDATPTAVPTTASIRYTADGLGQDFTLTIDSVTAAGAAYDPAQPATTTPPLTDAVNSSDAEDVNLGIVGGTAGTPVTVSVDNGALILKNGATLLTQGTATASGVIGTDTFEIVGTKSGLTTVTVTNAGRTKTAQFTVARQTDVTKARNVAISGPGEAISGDQIAFTVVVTDAFGNPIPGFSAQNLNIQVTGPAEFQDSDAVTNAAGELKVNVGIDDDADGPVSVRVQGLGAQFGATANNELPGQTAGAAQGLTASSNVATATVADVTNLVGLEQAVKDAEAKVAAATAAKNEAQANRNVAQARLTSSKQDVKAARQDVKQARKALQKAKKKGKGVAAAQANLRAAKAELRSAKGDKKVAAKQVKAAQLVLNNANANLAAAQAELEAAQEALEEAQN